jgi:phosphatidylserine decarboxylase
VFSLSFFRDPTPSVAPDPAAIVAPGHGTVDVIDETIEKEFMGGACRRISIFLSVFDVHVQNSPISGRVAHLKHCEGQFVNAMRTDCGSCNENVLLGLEARERGERVAVRLIAGLLARRIVPWVAEGDEIAKGERTSLIQFGSRVDLYLPLSAGIKVKLGDKVKGGETVVATWA